MKSKTRYNIRLAGRKGVAVREGTAEDLPGFCCLMQITGQRDGFGIHSKSYYETAYQLFVPQGLAKLFLATYEDRVLAGIMAFAFGQRAWYMYGASSDEHRDLMPNYLLQWEAIQWAKERGCLTYDLWGVPDEEEEVLEKEFLERSDGLWGVYRFKRGFGGQVVHYLGAYDYVYSPLLYRLYSRLMAWRVTQG
jgi:lipid II:glycine glycyltransferase (peptidoglycan interpeptide bridge formation enzyme)